MSRRRKTRPYAELDLVCDACDAELGSWGRHTDRDGEKPWLRKAPGAVVDDDRERLIFVCACPAPLARRMDRLAATLDKLVREQGPRSRAVVRV
jgi:predicted RNA polymerase sigma factor